MIMGVVRHQATGEIYDFLGGNDFVNLRTKVKGTVPTETAQKIFKIQPELTVLFNDYPNLKELVGKLNLKVDSIIEAHQPPLLQTLVSGSWRLINDKTK